MSIIANGETVYPALLAARKTGKEAGHYGHSGQHAHDQTVGCQFISKVAGKTAPS